MSPRNVIVEQNPDKPVEKSVLAQNILAISAAAQKLNTSGLNEKAVVVLLHDSTGLGKGTITAVLHALKNLERDYCRK